MQISLENSSASIQTSLGLSSRLLSGQTGGPATALPTSIASASRPPSSSPHASERPSQLQARPSVRAAKGPTPGALTDLVLLPSAPRDSDDGLTDEETRSLDAQVEHDLDPDSQATAVEVREDIRVVSRKVVRLARDVLRSSKNGSQSTGATSAAGQPKTEPLARPRAGSVNPASPQKDKDVGSGSPGEEEVAQPASIYLLDVFYRNFEFPFELCRTWEVREDGFQSLSTKTLMVVYLGNAPHHPRIASTGWSSAYPFKSGLGSEEYQHNIP